MSHLDVEQNLITVLNLKHDDIASTNSNVDFHEATKLFDLSHCVAEIHKGVADEENTYERNGSLILQSDFSLQHHSSDFVKHTSNFNQQFSNQAISAEYNPAKSNLKVSQTLENDCTRTDQDLTYPLQLDQEQHLQIAPDCQALVEYVCSILYWRNVKKSAQIFGQLFVILLCVIIFPILSIVAYIGVTCISLGLMYRCLSIGTRHFGVDKQVDDVIISSLQKCFPSYTRSPLIDENVVIFYIPSTVKYLNSFLESISNVLKAKDLKITMFAAAGFIVLSLIAKFASFAGFLLITLVASFTIPKFFEVYEKPIADYSYEMESRVRHLTTNLKQGFGKISLKKD